MESFKAQKQSIPNNAAEILKLFYVKQLQGDYVGFACPGLIRQYYIMQNIFTINEIQFENTKTVECLLNTLHNFGKCASDYPFERIQS